MPAALVAHVPFAAVTHRGKNNPERNAPRGERAGAVTVTRFREISLAE